MTPAFGRFALNTTVGGLNPAAVLQFAHIAGGYGRIVEMPTRDVDNGRAPATETRPWVAPWEKLFPGRPTHISTSKNGELLPEAKAMITMLATATTSSGARLVLATGHAADDDHELLAREARRQNVTVVLTHPDRMAPARLHALAALGAFIEVNASVGPAHGQDADTWAAKAVERMRGIGVEQVVMGSDAGQTDRPLPGDELAMAAKALRAHGFTEAELDKIFKENPARLLGLPPLQAKSSTGR